MFTVNKNKNMKINTQSKILMPLVLLMLIGGLVVIEKNRSVSNVSTPSTKNTKAPTKSELEKESAANANAKQQFIDNPPTSPSAATTSISLSAQTETNDTVTIFTKLYGYSSGECTLTIHNAGKSVTKMAAVIYQSEFSTCAGFSLPKAELNAGDWEIKLTVNNNGAISTKDISYKVE
jgi:hypothetical protein